jgi:hypothetical protein
MFATMRVQGHSGGFMMDAIAGVDIALWDLAGNGAAFRVPHDDSRPVKTDPGLPERSRKRRARGRWRARRAWDEASALSSCLTAAQ